MLVVLYDRNRKKLTRAKQIFKDLFPTVFEIFYKIRGSGKGERFAILLQTIEAYIVLKVIYPRLLKEHPEINAYTIHDSFLVIEKSEIVKSIMIEELKQFTGYKPIIKIDDISIQ
jgi:hypothetical protein